MNKLNKKQIPQFAALCLLSAGVFGYFVVKIVTPSPAAAGTRPQILTPVASTTPTPSHAAGRKTGAGPDAAPAGNEAEAPAPTPGMRDPFVVGYVDPKARPPLPAPPSAKPVKAAGPQVASIHEVGSASVGVPALPFGLKGFPPLGTAPALPAGPRKAAAPAPPAAPVWTVTGVLQNGAGQVAVLRSGEARRIVRTGDFVDSVYRVVTVTRNAVVLRHDKTFYHLMLGEAKPSAPTPAPPAPAFPSIPGPAHTPVYGPTDETEGAGLFSGTQPARPRTAIAEVIGAALRLARSYMAPAQLRMDACFLSFRPHTGGTPSVATLPLDGWTPAPGPDVVQAPLDLGRDVYGSGQTFGGRAQWRCALATGDLDAAGEAGKLTDRYN